jgi:molybdopterin converting factor small subunit
MKILFYGRLADAIGREVELDDAEGLPIARIRERLANEYPAAASVLTGGRSRAYVDGALVRDDYQAGPSELVEFLPPVSGG